MRTINNCTLVLSALVWVTAQTNASVTEYTDKPAWQAAVGNNYVTADFTGYPNNTFITNQYASLGVLFTDGNDSIHLSQSFVNDGAGLDGNNIIHLSFASPMEWIAIDFPGTASITLTNQGNAVYTSNQFKGGGTGNFGGLVSSTPFDGAVIFKLSGFDVVIDDLHFGPPVPGPAGLAVLALGGLLPSSRRRRRAVGSP